MPSFTHADRLPLILFEAMALALVLVLAFSMGRLNFRWYRVAERGLGRLAQRRGLSIALVGVLALAGSATVALLVRMPEPRFHDEFSYLLAADTFADGRLSNPTHPLWVHFETFHVLQQPTYASKYPPAQGVMLAAGKLIGGHPIVGVWISIGLACAAIYWMLLAWLPPWWALLGGLLAVVRMGIFGYWSQSYWGGAVAVIGSALLFGALRRIIDQPRVRQALLLGVGLAILANSRPYEGLFVSLPVGVVLLGWIVGKNAPSVRVSVERIMLPVLGVLILTAGAMGIYNWRVTGDVFRFPHQVYGRMPVLWRTPSLEPPQTLYHHKVMWEYDVQEVVQHIQQFSFPGFVWVAADKLDRLWRFYLGLALTVPLVTLPWLVRDWWMRFVLVTCGVLILGLLVIVPFLPHYAAPLTGLVFILVLQAMRHLRLWQWHGRPVGRFVVWSIPMICVVSLVVALVQQMRVDPSAWYLQRTRILAQLQQNGGRHLVVVRYGSRHSPAKEWVYNEADIDAAKVVWGREMETAQNRTLVEYFKDRQVWLLDVAQDQASPKPVPYTMQ